MNSEEIVNKEFKIILKYLIKHTKLANRVTDNFQLDYYGKKMFGKKYIGTYSHDKVPLNKLKNDCYCILNIASSEQNGLHWIACYSNNKTVYIYDSFGRKSKKLLKPFLKRLKDKKFKTKDSDYDVEQSNTSEICGQLCLSFLYIVLTRGIQKALLI